MPVSRNPNQEYSAEYLSGLPRVEPSIRFDDIDGSPDNVSGDNPMPVRINSPISAFGELLVSELSPQFQGSFEYTVSNTLIHANTVANGGTVTQASAMAVVGSSTTTASTAQLKSVSHAKYRSGIGAVIRFSGLFTTGVAATEQYIGIADELGSSATYKNGLAVGYNGAAFGFHRWSNDTLTSVAQSAWDDPLDGTGASGMTLDPTKLNVFFIQFQWLGAGAINLFVENDATGLPQKVHTILYANNFTVPSTFQPNYHFSMRVDNAGTTDDLIVKTASYGLFIQGQTGLKEIHQPVFSTPASEKTSVTTEVAVVTIRCKTSYASKTNFIDVLLKRLSASIEATGSANNLSTIRMVLNATLGGTPSYTDISTTNSVVDFDIAGTTVTGGTQIGTFFLAGKNDTLNKDLVLTDYADFVLSFGDTITISISSANTATVNASLSWKELI